MIEAHLFRQSKCLLFCQFSLLAVWVFFFGGNDSKSWNRKSKHRKKSLQIVTDIQYYRYFS